MNFVKINGNLYLSFLAYILTIDDFIPEKDFMTIFKVYLLIFCRGSYLKHLFLDAYNFMLNKIFRMSGHL